MRAPLRFVLAAMLMLAAGPVLVVPVLVLPVLAQPVTDAARGNISASEMELQATLRGDIIRGRITIPDSRAANLIQPEGREWREFHNVTLGWIGGIAVLGMLALLVIFYLARGKIRMEGGPSGRTIQRFNWFERANHWMTASTFIILALSGLNITFGRYLLLPLFGPEIFAEATQLGKIAHNYLSFPFALGIVVMFLLWIRDNIPNALDVAWLRAGGGIIGHGHPPADRFNAGQKMIFWITVLGGGLVAASGYLLIFPFFFTGMQGMQLALIVHGILAVLMIAAMLGHIYIGTIGMEGAFDAMGTGQVDYNWARAHHSLWVEKEVVRARSTIDGTAKPAGAD
ncbi:formate dehydrogenase gamma subunit [Humitalea rosea]|uniref:Formate dehydrogenase gamma subunit n=1 Tax=Humitalea rosea TaxID=990373 RepID=A0A2W7I6H0_9PROT|nr:formate dehydrogenase subunit gamma [Humitalea rosea]PZW42254.1 formate dehydrogenase gamma subunit [Humitalea rosea]